MKEKEIFTVSQINGHLKNIVKNNIPNLFIQGELSNCTLHRSGHLYFSLKDEKATIRGVMFRYHSSMLDFVPQNGDEIICFGKLDIYEAGGMYQIIVSQMEKSGLGDLGQKFEQLKKKLESEGLFEEIYKKKIPKFPKKIGIITSASGAAIQDIRNVLSRRFPCQIYLYPATVQGEKAVKSILKGIKYFEEFFPVDTLILGRGGGSQEDLFCFNSEELARAIFAAKTPIISAVGHEIDFTITDFVADLRAPTPSAAAELAVPNKNDLFEQLEKAKELLKLKTGTKISFFEQKINKLHKSLLSLSPFAKLKETEAQLDKYQIKIDFLLSAAFNKIKENFKTSASKLQELSPLKTLARGYTISRQKEKTLRTINQLDKNEPLELIFSDGYAQIEIKSIKKTKLPQE